MYALVKLFFFPSLLELFISDLSHTGCFVGVSHGPNTFATTFLLLNFKE